LNVGNINAAQLSSLSQPLAVSLLTLDQALAKIPGFPPVRITSITDDHIFSGTCSRVDGVNTPLSADKTKGCQHAQGSDHYGGALFYCKNFDQAHPPISCAADLAFEKSLSPVLRAIYYPILLREAKNVQMTHSGCETSTSSSWANDCMGADINHVHVGISGCVNL
jgi:hypothetical protein